MSIIELIYQDKLAEKEFPKEDSLSEEMKVKVIKDALTTTSKDIVFVIANDYNKKNNLPEIKHYTKDNLAFLTSNGAQLAKQTVEEPKYCSLRNCGGLKYVECSDSIYDFVSKDEIVNHIVNQVKGDTVNQIVNYFDSFGVCDTDSELTVDKVRTMLENKLALTHSARVKILKKLLNKVKESDDELTRAKRFDLDRLIVAYEDNPKDYPYKMICKKIIQLFRSIEEIDKINEWTSEHKEEIEDLKEQLAKAWSKNHKMEEIDWNSLPEAVKNKFNEILENSDMLEAVNNLKSYINKVANRGKELRQNDEPLDKVFKEDFRKYLGVNYVDNVEDLAKALKKFCKEHEIDAKKFASIIVNTKSRIAQGEFKGLTVNGLEKWFYQISQDPKKYARNIIEGVAELTGASEDQDENEITNSEDGIEEKEKYRDFYKKHERLIKNKEIEKKTVQELNYEGKELPTFEQFYKWSLDENSDKFLTYTDWYQALSQLERILSKFTEVIKAVKAVEKLVENIIKTIENIKEYYETNSGGFIDLGEPGGYDPKKIENIFKKVKANYKRKVENLGNTSLERLHAALEKDNEKLGEMNNKLFTTSTDSDEKHTEAQLECLKLLEKLK